MEVSTCLAESFGEKHFNQVFIRNPRKSTWAWFHDMGTLKKSANTLILY